METRTLTRVIPSIAAADGAGVKLRRSLGAQPGLRVDPFLMLDEFYSDDPDDYLAGFPTHPHRGFETVTIMLDGHMLHEDHLGNRGDLKPGDVQWMTAARGILHSEMPQQTEGRMRGFQLWLNLPSHLKMQPADYQDIAAASIPQVALGDGGVVRVIAGQLQTPDGTVTTGAVQRPVTEPQLWDARLAAGTSLKAALPAELDGFIYLYEGAATIAGRDLPLRGAALLSSGDQLDIQAGENGARLLLIAGRPLHEPVVQYGPFVMNTREQIEQALADYRDGTLAA